MVRQRTKTDEKGEAKARKEEEKGRKGKKRERKEEGQSLDCSLLQWRLWNTETKCTAVISKQHYECVRAWRYVISLSCLANFNLRLVLHLYADYSVSPCVRTLGQQFRTVNCESVREASYPCKRALYCAYSYAERCCYVISCDMVHLQMSWFDLVWYRNTYCLRRQLIE